MIFKRVGEGRPYPDHGLTSTGWAALPPRQVRLDELVTTKDTLQLAADTAIQLQGARGYAKDSVAEWIYRYARQARLVDGASEVHEMVIAQLWREQGLEFWN